MKIKRTKALQRFEDRPVDWRQMLVLVGLLGLLFLFLSPSASADIILLTNGKTLEGTLENLSDGKVRVRLAYGSLSLPKDQIATVHRAQTFEELVKSALEKLSPLDARGRYELAQQAQTEQSLTLYRRLLEDVVAIDSDHERARRELGFLPFEGAWVTRAQLHELKGEVQFRGEWVAPQTRDQILIAEAEHQRISRDRQQVQIEATRQRQEAAVAAQREATALAATARPASYSSGFRTGCNFGFSSGAYGFGRIYGGYGSGPAFQPLQPFQPSLVQVPNQTYRYSVHQNIRARPGRSPQPYVGYRADPPPQRRQR